MRKRVFAILFLVIPVLAYTQSSDTVFTVKAPVSTLRLLPETDFLYKDISKRFKLIKPASFRLDTIIFTGGSCQLKDSILILKATKSKTVLLQVYEKLPGGKRKLVLVKEFGVQKFSEPVPNLDGVNTDSAIHRMKLAVQGYVNVPIKRDPELKRYSYPVLSFQVQVVGPNGTLTDTATGNRMTYQMRDRVDKMAGGNSIDITNIRYVMQGDTFTIQQPLRVFIINDTIHKF